MAKNDRGQDGYLVVALSLPLLLVIAGWSYWPVVADLLSIWQHNEDYSAGQLVPLVVAFLVWCDRKAIVQSPPAACWAGGVALLILAELLRTYGFLSVRPSAEHYALVLTVVGLVLMGLGRQVFRRVFWILLFLFLMVPLPGVVHNTVGGSLQSAATAGSVFLLQVFRISVIREGNVLTLNGGAQLEVAQACSGLRMLMAFIVVAAFIAYMVKRPRWQKGVLFLSSIPVAVVCNVVRIFVTGLLVLYVGEDVAKGFFHDFAGFVMMPFAVMLLFAEIWVMDRIVVTESEPSPSRLNHPGPQIIVSRRVPGQRYGTTSVESDAGSGGPELENRNEDTLQVDAGLFADRTSPCRSGDYERVASGRTKNGGRRRP